MSDWSQAYSIPGNQYILHGARNTTIGQAVFNNAGRDLTHNYFDANPLWDAIADVGASHNSEQQVERGRCLPGTREAVLRLVHNWRVSEGHSFPVCWLSGAAGVGKSAIALTVAEECEKDGLVASFFFFRSDPRRNNPSSLILSITHGLVVTRPHLKPLVDKRIAADPRILKARLEDQYKELILENLKQSVPSSPSSAQRIPDLVIIDGLDECSDAVMQRRVLSIMFSTYRQPFQSPLRFLICSRPESWIQQEFFRFNGLTKHIELNDSFRPRYDIELYFHQQFQEIRRNPDYSQIIFPVLWPSPEVVSLLVEKADGQFIYAATAMNFIKTEYTLPTDQLLIILNAISNKQPPHSSTHSPFADLDELYRIVLHANPDHDKRLVPILSAIVLIPNPSPAFIELLLGLSSGTVAQTLRAMHSVLDVRDRREDNIRIYHASFGDFLYDSTRSREFFIDKLRWGDFLACRWTRALSESCQNDPELLRGDGDLDKSSLTRTLVKEWENFCLFDSRNDHDGMSRDLISELDNFYHTGLSIAGSELGHEMLLHILAAILLLPPNGSRSPQFIQLILGIRGEDWKWKLRVMHKTFWVEGIQTNFNLNLRVLNDTNKLDIRLRHYRSTFTGFLFDRSRSQVFFIDKDYHSNFLAQRCIRLLQKDEGEPNWILSENWARICSGVDNPSEDLLSELDHMVLGDVMDTIINPNLWLSISIFRLRRLFSDFKTITSWLKSKDDGAVLTNTIDHFEAIQNSFHIRKTRIDPELHNDVVSLIILSIVDWDIYHYQSSTRFLRLIHGLHYHFKEAMFSLSSADFSICKCSRSGFVATTLVPGVKDLYHVDISAGCAQILKVLVADLKSTRDVDEEMDIVNNLLVHSRLLTRCVPRPELLPLCRTIWDAAQKQVGRIHRPFPQESRGRLLSWLESFPADCAHETETMKELISRL